MDIQRMLADLTRGGVPYVSLGEVGTFVRGNGLQKKDLTDSGVPAIHYGQIHTTYGVWADQTVSYTTPERAAKLRVAHPGDLVIATTSEDDAGVGKATAWIGNSDAVVSGDAYVYRHSQNPKFVSYFFNSTSYQDQKKSFITGTKVRRISDAGLSRIMIPVPSLAVQCEVVRVLDLFTKLEAELEARRKQYAHYRDQLLRFNAPPRS